MSEHADRSDELEAQAFAEEGGVRVFWITAPTMHQLVDGVATKLSEHMRDDDELHIDYNAMQSGWTDHAPVPASLLRKGQPGWTELRFEYSAFVVLRQRAQPPEA